PPRSCGDSRSRAGARPGSSRLETASVPTATPRMKPRRFMIHSARFRGMDGSDRTLLLLQDQRTPGIRLKKPDLPVLLEKGQGEAAGKPGAVVPVAAGRQQSDLAVPALL